MTRTFTRKGEISLAHEGIDKPIDNPIRKIPGR